MLLLLISEFHVQQGDSITPIPHISSEFWIRFTTSNVAIRLTNTQILSEFSPTKHVNLSQLLENC